MTKPRPVSVPAGNARVTFSISDLYAPFLTAEENADVLKSLPAGAKVYATYRHTTYSYQLFGCLVGVACFPAPGWSEQSTEEHRSFPARIVPGASPGAPRAFVADVPHSIGDGYTLSGLAMTVSPAAFYRQPSYRALVAKLPLSDLERDPPDPMFEYMVDFRDHDLEQSRDQQDCLFVSTPFQFPEIRIPIVVHLDIDSKRMALTRLMHETCPMADEDFGNPTGHLPAARIAATQAKIDLEGVHNQTRLVGALPVTEDMTRWFHRNSEGTYADLTEYGPYRQLWMRVRGDSAHPAYNMLPVRTEIWTFYDDKLVGYSGDIFYDTPSEKVEDMNTIHWDQYFRNGQSVWSKFEPTHCDEQGCKDAQAEIRDEMSKPYDTLQAEAKSYLQLRGALRPKEPE